MARVVVLGDLHGAFDDSDARWLNADEPDAIVLLGDLGGNGAVPACAPAIASLRPRVAWIPGNHDGITFARMAAEIVGPSAAAWLDGGIEARVRAVEAALAPARMVAWTAWPVGPLWVIAGRPHSLGGPAHAFAAWTKRAWGIGSLDASAERLSSLVDQAPAGAPILFFGHNGPSGCGGAREDPFGRDFDPRAGDWGDPDLRVAIARARDQGRLVVAIGGHMHHRLRGGGARRTVHVEGPRVAVINAAVVPRIDRGGGRHHVEVEATDAEIVVSAVRVIDGVRDVRVLAAAR